ncbi:MAG: RnfABCDGE type electron transport complex subunit D, partial [Candidatus Cloacimonetes bacterium]|nr:RnfABCDGE type electron transport complex subunit D [Candidatus Cloacimonadota bacterium]
MKDKFTVSPAPHLHDRTTIPTVMWNVVLALVPALIFAVYYWGFKSLLLTLLGAVSAVATEALIQKLRKVPIAVADGSAFLTGMLLAYNIHVGAPFWLPIVGSVFAIAVGKQVFGGLGNNPVNPALLGRAFLLASWPTLMTGGWVKTLKGSISGINPDLIANNLKEIAPKAFDLVTSATPLKVAQTLRDSTWISSLSSDVHLNATVATNTFNSLFDFSTLKELFWGNVGGCIGEVSAFALLLGAAWLLYKN